MGAEIDRIAFATNFNGQYLLDGSRSFGHDGSGLNSSGAFKIHFGPGNDSAEDYYYIGIGDASLRGLGLSEPTASWWQQGEIDPDNRRIIFNIENGKAGTGSPYQAGNLKGMDIFMLPSGLKDITVHSVNADPAPAHKPHVSLFNRDGKQLTGVPADTEWATGRTTLDANNVVVPEMADGSSWWNSQSGAQIIQNGINSGIFNPGAKYDGASIINRAGQSDFSTGAEIRIVTDQSENMGVDEQIYIEKITDNLVFMIGGHEGGANCEYYSLSIDAKFDDNFIAMLTAHDSGGALPIDTQEKAQQTLVKIDAAIERKDKIRAHLGAMQNRLENTVTNLQTSGENIQAAESRISDVDIGKEMSIFVCNQILSQSATAMLGQANSLPQMLQSLLR